MAGVLLGLATRRGGRAAWRRSLPTVRGMPSGLALLLIVAMGVVVLAGGIMRVYHPVTEGWCAAP